MFQRSNDSGVGESLLHDCQEEDSNRGQAAEGGSFLSDVIFK